jgi:hypothetical protein
MPESSSSKPSRPSAAIPVGGIDATVISGRAADAGRQTSIAEIGRLLEGHALGPYRLDRFVGGGGMGAVFRALDTTLDRVVAVKVLSRQQSNDEEMLRRFRNEAQSAARLDHENIGRVHAVGSDDGWHYIVFEFIEGTNLRDVVQAEGPFDLARTIDVAIQVAEALEHASDRDVVHRDIKPSNIIITPAGRARVVDMGLARLHHMAGDQDLTVSGVTLGTFDYISPEQARDPRSADVRSDLYSLGCTIFFMLTGRPPFADGTMVQKLLQHQQDPPPAIESLRPDVPRRFGAILGRLMEKEPADRYQRPADLVVDLVAMADELGIEVAGPRTLPAAPGRAAPARARHLPWLLPVAGLCAVVGSLWWRASDAGREATAGRLATAPLTVIGPDQQSAEVLPDEPVPRTWRVVDTPEVDADCSTVGEAVRQASDGDVVEIACAEPRDNGPFVIEGKRLTIRAAEGFDPLVRCPESALVSRDGGWCTIASGALAVQRVSFRLAGGSSGAARPAVFCLRGGATLDCEDVAFATAGDAAAAVWVRAERQGGERQEVRMTAVQADGGAAVVESRGDGRLDLFWSAGRAVLPGRFLVAEGAEQQGAAGRIRMSLEDGLFACGDGFVALLDSPSLPLAPRLTVLAKSCRFLVPEGRPVLLQAGVGDAEAYRPAVEWIDAASRYEGSGVLRRIDGAAERFEIDFSSHPQALDHEPRIAEWPGAGGRDAD